MRFDSFLQALDMGICEDQLQREALLDIALLFIAVDGHVDQNETAFLNEWLNTLPWSGEIDQQSYYKSTMEKCLQAVNDNDVDAFIQHRAKQLIDGQLKLQALQLANDISHADGELDEREAAAIAILHKALA